MFSIDIFIYSGVGGPVFISPSPPQLTASLMFRQILDFYVCKVLGGGETELPCGECDV